MKREILFKAKRVDNGEWVDGYYVITANNHHQILNGKWCNKTGCHFVYNVHPETVCQFTGLLDNNGKHYAFDDIVRFPDGSIGMLVWFDDCLGIGSGEFGNYHAIDQVRKKELELCEIIGSIHDKK